MVADLRSVQDVHRDALLYLKNPETDELPLDEGVRNALPNGITVFSVHSHGNAAWSLSARIDAEDGDGNETPFFLKYVIGDLGKDQLGGEFRGMSDMHALAPDLVPEPIAWGECVSVQPKSHFLILKFKDFEPGLPDPVKLGQRLAAMHKRSVSPNGMFGYHMQTYDGARLQAIEWDPSWTSFFGKLLAEAYRQSVQTAGPWPAFDIVMARVQSHLIPRLIGILESDGRKVKPVLLHGNMWDGNVGSEVDTGDPWIYDCAAYYGHNEMELGIWRAERHKLKAKIYRSEYATYYPPAEPAEEFEDRVLLYSAKTNFMHVACYANSPARQLAFNQLTRLIEKYVPWESGDAEWLEVQKHLTDNAGGI